MEEKLDKNHWKKKKKETDSNQYSVETLWIVILAMCILTRTTVATVK
jgi:hypothetical protein